MPGSKLVLIVQIKETMVYCLAGATETRSPLAINTKRSRRTKHAKEISNSSKSPPPNTSQRSSPSNNRYRQEISRGPLKKWKTA